MSSSSKSSIKFLCVVVLFAPLLLFAGEAIAANVVAGSSESPAYGIMTETPEGAINGWNTDFRLSDIPQPNSPVRLYRNGVLLVDPTDYQIRSNVITFSPIQVPQVGDILSVSYVCTGTATRSVESPTSNPSSARYLDEISIAATREALRDEESRVSTFRDGSLTDRRLRLPHGPKQRVQHDLEALQMLSARLTEQSPDVADGVEGLGDATAPSIYTYHRIDTINGRSLPVLRNRYPQSPTSAQERRSSRAIEMLERRLGANDPEQLGDVGSGLNSPNRGSFASRDGYDPRPLYQSRASRTLSSEALNMLDRQLSNNGQLDVPGGSNSEQ